MDIEGEVKGGGCETYLSQRAPKLELLRGGGMPVTSTNPPLLSLIQGSQDEQKWMRLICDPASFSLEEFEFLVDEVFRDRLTPSECMDLLQVRIEVRQAREPGLENNVLCAILRNDDAEYERLKRLLKCRNALQLSVIKGGLA